MTADTDHRAPARSHNHVCREIPCLETQTVTNGIVGEGIVRNRPLSHYVFPHNLFCHAHADAYEAAEYRCRYCGERGDFDPVAISTALATVNKAAAHKAISAIVPTRGADGEKLPEGLRKALADATFAAYRRARREVYPARGAKQS